MLIPTFAQQLELILVFLLISVSVILVSYAVARTQFSAKVDCLPEKDWGPWSSCTRNCLGGNQYRTRAVARMALHGGAQCNELIQSRSCNEDIPCGINCVPGNPANFEWNPCPRCTKNAVQPIQFKTVIPVREATYMGQDCDIDSVIMTRECVNVPPCPPDIDCKIEPYEESACSALCGSGTKNIFSRITVLPSGDGKQCDLGDLVQQVSCYEGSCGCEAANWSGTFSECNAACGPGIKIMMRSPEDLLPQCPFVSTTSCEIIPCPNNTCIAPSIDFVQALCYMQCAGLPFPEIDPQLCGYIDGGFSQSFLDAVCGNDLGGSLRFNESQCVEPVDCSLTAFSDFSDCSLPCLASEPLGGTRTRIRTIVSPGNSGGASCVDQVFLDIEPCNNRVPVSYSAFNTATNEFVASVSSPQCPTSGCSLSLWYSVSGFLGGCGDCSQMYNRSLSFIGNVDQCPTDPTAYYSLSSCCGRSLNTNIGPCYKLPKCTQCVWKSIEDYAFNCNGVTVDEVLRRDMPLVSYSNNPDVTCETGFNCYYDTNSNAAPGPDFYGNSQFSCSSYFYSCSGGTVCPRGCNGQTCNGNGQTVNFTNSVGHLESCSCLCYKGFSGVACEVVEPRCPFAAGSELECNGAGICSTETNPTATPTCQCDNPFDETPNCTGSSTSWCWIYGNITGALDNTTNTVLSIRKLLGVIPIASTTNYYFSEEDCRDVASVQISSIYKSSVSTYNVKPLILGSETPVPVTGSVDRLNLFGLIRSSVPATLANELSAPCSTEIASTRDLLNAGFSADKTQYFIPRYVPFSSPVQCESLFTIRTFSGGFNYFGDSQLQLSSTVLGPVLDNYYP